MKYRPWQYLLTFSVGAGLTWQTVPHEFKTGVPTGVELFVSVVIGGLYAVEKLIQQPGSNTQLNQDLNTQRQING